MTFEEKLRKEIEFQYDSVYHFAQVIGMSRSVFSTISKSGIDAVSPKTIERIAKGLGLSDTALKEKRIEPLPLVKPENHDEETKPFYDFIKENNLTTLEASIVTAIRELSMHGQYKVYEYIEDILPKYKRK